jgi:hypothetical protein
VRRAAFFTLLGALLLAAPAFSQPNPGTFFIRASAGFASQSLEDWNDEIDTFNSQVLPSASFDDFGGAFPFGVELGYQLKPALSLSVGVFRQSDSADNTYSDASGSLTLDTEVAMTAVTGAVSYWPLNTHGVFLGADIGMGFGTAKQNLVFRDFNDPANDFDLSGDWSGNGVVAGAFVGFQHQVSSGFLLHGRLGYQFQNLGKFDGDITSAQLGSGSTPPINLFTGQTKDTDFSGVQALFGIGFAFGGQ